MSSVTRINKSYLVLVILIEVAPLRRDLTLAVARGSSKDCFRTLSGPRKIVTVPETRMLEALRTRSRLLCNSNAQLRYT